MAKYNHGFGVAFNDNDGGAAWFATHEGLEDYRRYASAMGWLRARLFFLRMAWVSVKNTERFALRGKELPPWRRLRGWTP